MTAAPVDKLVFTTPPPTSLVAGQPFTVVISAEDQFHNVNSTFNGQVTLSMPGVPGFPVMTQAISGVATFSGLTVPAAVQASPIQAAANGLPIVPGPPVTISPAPVPPSPSVIGETVATTRKMKKGKPTGPAVVTGFTLFFSTAMNSSIPGNQRELRHGYDHDHARQEEDQDRL